MSPEIMAVFVGGPWDGKEYNIPFVQEFRVAIMKQKAHWISSDSDPSTTNAVHDIAVYRHVLNELYWFAGIEKHEQ